MLSILLSGPKAAESQARNALAAKGFRVVNLQAREHPHGFPPETDDAGQAVAFVKCEGEDVNAAWDAVRALGFRLRADHEINQDVIVVGRVV